MKCGASVSLCDRPNKPEVQTVAVVHMRSKCDPFFNQLQHLEGYNNLVSVSIG